MPGSKRTASGVLGGLLGVLGLSAVAGLLVTATITPALAVSGTAASGAISIFEDLPGNLEIDELMMPTVLYYKNAEGKNVEMTRFYEQNRSPVTYDQVAPVFIDAVTSSEDGHFFEHGGIDLIGTIRALAKNSGSDGATSGGSTISQQYVKNVLMQQCEADASTEEEKLACFDKAAGTTGNDGIARKLQEMRYAIALEQTYSKETILLGYINIANFGGVNYGVDAASRYYFGVSAAKLNLSQAATIAGILQNPNNFRIDRPDDPDNGAENGYALTKQRQISVLYNMHKDGKITDEEYEAAKEAPIEPKITDQKKGCSAAVGMEYYCQMVKGLLLNDPALGADDEARLLKLNRGGLKIFTTVDPRMQQRATEGVHSLVPSTLGFGSFGGAVVNIENSTGRVLAVAQNTVFSELEEDAAKPGYSSLVYAADQRFGSSMGTGFPAGSTFKIFTLLDWLETGHSVNERLDGRNRSTFNIMCNGVQINTGEQVREVGNFAGGAGSYGTPMSFTASSMNTGFFAMAEKLNICTEVPAIATKLGVLKGDTLEPVKIDGAFSLLGSNNNSPLAIAGAYGAVANGGVYCQPKLIDKVTDSYGTDAPQYLPKTSCTPQLKPEVAATAAYALQGVMNGGTGVGAKPDDYTPLIGKTGTHQEHQTWMVEASTSVTTAAWVGNVKDDQIDMQNTWVDLAQTYASEIRYPLARYSQELANQLYPGTYFPEPDDNLTRRVLVNIPDVVGMTVDEAIQTLTNAGIGYTVGAEVDAPEAKGTITVQDPPGGMYELSSVTITPSNGNGAKMPDVSGQKPGDAVATINAAGFSNVTTKCVVNKDASNDGSVTSTNPAAGAAASKGAQVTVTYEQKKCS